MGGEDEGWRVDTGRGTGGREGIELELGEP